MAQMNFCQFCYDINQRKNISSFGNVKFCCFQPHLLCVACGAYDGESKWRNGCTFQQYMTMLLLELRMRRRWETKVTRSHLVEKQKCHSCPFFFTVDPSIQLPESASSVCLSPKSRRHEGRRTKTSSLVYQT